MRDPIFERAEELILRARRNAAAREYDAGDRQNPTRAKPGRDADFYAARRDVRAYDVVLALLEKEAKRRRIAEAMTRAEKAKRGLEIVFDFLVVLGVELLAALGFAAAALLFHAPEEIVRGLAALGCAAALANTCYHMGK